WSTSNITLAQATRFSPAGPMQAICIGGDRKPSFKDRGAALTINRKGAARVKAVFPEAFLGVLKSLGTYGLLALNQEAGNLPTRNFTQAFAESQELAEAVDHVKAKEHLVGKSRPCKACYVACKKRYSADSPHADKHSVAEYESIALLGPNLGLEESLADGFRACELCNALGLDTMSMGNIAAWLMDCFENGVLTEQELGFSIRFGDGDKVCQLIEDVAFRRGKLGNLLADGVLKAQEVLGEECRPYLRASRGIGLPAHMPRKKPGIGFGYLHGPNLADHMKLEHDWLAGDPDMLEAFGLQISSEPTALDESKVEIARITQIYYSAVDSLSLCMFVFGPGNLFSFGEITDMVNAATGLDLTFADLMEAGERSVQLQRKLYLATGGRDEEFLGYLETEIPAGPSKGQRIKKADFDKAREHYYSLWGWCSASP
ncbi:aldehyde ferredoxin oxidoreductase C-terminal domain-containing protein, partial [Planctomycetota bacterium]